jgi:hypothetical protein
MYSKLDMSDRWLSAIYCLNFPLYFLGGCLSSIYIATGSIHGQYRMRLGLQGSYLILLYILLITNSLSVSTIIVTYIGMHTISLWIGWYLKDQLLEGGVSYDKPPKMPLIKAFIPHFLESFSTRIDIWAFSWFSTLVSLGQYTGIKALMLPVGLVSNAMTSASTARLDWTDPQVVIAHLSKMLLLLVGLLIALLAGGWWVGPYILDLVLGNSFRSGYWMIPWVVVILVTQAASIQFHTALRLAGHTNAYLYIQSTEPFLRLLLVIIFGWLLAEKGIMIGLAITSTLKAGLCFWFHTDRPTKAV